MDNIKVIIAIRDIDGIIEACKKRNAMHLENIDYVIGNLNYLPFLDNSFTFMLNCFALIDAKEFYRVLKDNGYFIRILPDFDHLLNLKEFLYENVILNEMKEKQRCGFKLIEEVHIKDDILLKNNILLKKSLFLRRYK